MGIVSSPPRLERKELKPRDSKRKNLILDSKKEGKKHCAIAADANCSTRYVRKVLQDEHLRSDETDNAQKEPWYRRLLGDKLANLLVRIEAAQTGERKKYTSEIYDIEKVRLITKAELEANTFPHSWTDEKVKNKGVEWIRAHLTGSKVSSQGFVIMNGDAFEPSRDFVHLLEQKEYKKYFYKIFQELQSPATSSRGEYSNRWQVKMGDVFEVAAQSVKEAEGQLSRKIREDKTKEEYRQVSWKKRAEVDVVKSMLKHQENVYKIIYQVSPTYRKKSTLQFCADRAADSAGHVSMECLKRLLDRTFFQ